jgi:hypothetical protein
MHGSKRAGASHPRVRLGTLDDLGPSPRQQLFQDVAFLATMDKVLLYVSSTGLFLRKAQHCPLLLAFTARIITWTWRTSCRWLVFLYIATTLIRCTTGSFESYAKGR